MARDRIICFFRDYIDTRQNSNKNGIQYHPKSKNDERTYSSLLTCVKLRDNESCHSKMKIFLGDIFRVI
jgi:hypothetical protein